MDPFQGSRFFATEDGKRYATPLLLALVAIETTDFVFASDSLQVVIGITLKFFTAYTPNFSAFVGLRIL